MKTEKNIVIIGHSLAAPENRSPFASPMALPGYSQVFPTLQIAPKVWRSPGSAHTYLSEETQVLRPLKVTLSGHNTLIHYRGLQTCLRQTDPCLIYLWEEPWSLAALQVMRFARASKCPWLFFSAENRPKRLPPPFSALREKVFADAYGAIVPTPAIAENLRKSGYSGPIHTVPLWVPPRPFIKQAQPFPMAGRLAFIGRFIPLKRLDLLLQALVHMPKVELSLIGDGPEESGLRALAQKLGISDRIRFTGHVANENLHAALADCSLLVLLTDENAKQAEQFGKAVLDGLLCGLPVAVNPTGHLAHWPLEFPTVKPVDCQSPIHLAAGLSALLQSPPDAHSLMLAREKAQELYGPKTAALRFAQAFSHTLNQWSSASTKPPSEA